MPLSELNENHSPARTFASVGLALWFALIFFLGATGAFARAPGSLPLPILIGVTAPIIAFLIAFWLLPAFHDFVLSLDLRLVTGIQAWRFAGLGFLALYAHGVLPGLFAWPAGLGDIVIGVTATWIVLALIRQPNFAASRLFTAWNLLGILDLIAAVSTGALASALAAGVYGEVTTGPMAQLPLVLVPGYLVPLFVMLHLAALFQARRLAISQTGSPTAQAQREKGWLRPRAAPSQHGEIHAEIG